MIVQVLFSVMFQKDESLPRKSGVNGKYVLVNQTDFNKYPNIQNKTKDKIFISTEERGLSNSRNLAISLATGDICLIADDDLKYENGYKKIIENAYHRFTDADIILFDFLETDSIRKRKPVAKRAGKINIIQALHGNSVRISFKLKSIQKKKIKFNPLFGTGSKYFTSSEDLVFLIDSIRKGLNIYYMPIPILKLESDNSSTWFAGYNEQYFKNIGAFSFFFMKNWWFLYASQFLVRHLHFVHKKELNLKQGFIAIRKGVIEYKNLVSNK